MTLNDCTISGNSATGAGGGLDNSGTATLTDCTISGNTASNGSRFGDAGGLYNTMEATATLTDCTISGNSAFEDGGGLLNGSPAGTGGTATLTDCTISGNSATLGTGGGLDNAVG